MFQFILSTRFILLGLGTFMAGFIEQHNAHQTLKFIGVILLVYGSLELYNWWRVKHGKPIRRH